MKCEPTGPNDSHNHLCPGYVEYMKKVFKNCTLRFVCSLSIKILHGRQFNVIYGIIYLSGTQHPPRILKINPELIDCKARKYFKKSASLDNIVGIRV